MNTIKQLLNSFWIGAFAFGVAGTILWIMGEQWFAGLMFGAGATKFISAVRGK
jgi:formylmethanofuran:tetrahydromethanopterin formyltransferase